MVTESGLYISDVGYLEWKFIFIPAVYFRAMYVLYTLFFYKQHFYKQR